MSLLVRFTASDPAGSSYTLLDAAAGPVVPPGPIILQPVQWGDPGWDSSPSGARGTLGRSYVGPDYKDRTVVMSVRFYGSSKDDLLQRVAAFTRVLDACREWGGRLTRRAHLQTYRQHLVILDVPGWTFDLSRRGELSYRAEVVVTVTCAPYAEGDPLDVTDRFTTDTSGDYTRDAGSAGDLVVTGGELDAAANLTVENRWIHTSRGYRLTDQQTTMGFRVGATVASFKAGAVVKRVAATTYLEVHVTDNGTTSTLYLDKVVAGTRTTLASAAVTRLAANTAYTIRGRIERNVVYYSLEQTASPRVTPLTGETAYVLTGGDVTTFGQAATGQGGFSFNPRDTTAAVTMFEWLPYTYLATLPDTVRLRGIPGGADAIAAVSVGQVNKPAADFFLIGWTPATPPVNLLDKQTGDFTSGSTGWMWSWTSAASMFTTAGGTVSRAYVTDAKFGLYYLTVQTTAGTANLGANKVVYGRFRRGVTYTFRVWVKSPSSTAVVTAAVGNSGAGSASATVTLTTVWQQVTVTWTPTADVTAATICVYRAVATNADLFHIDGDELFEGTTAPTTPAQTLGRGAPAAFGVLEAENSGMVARASDADASAGMAAVGSAGLLVDANPVADPGGTALIEVWGRVKLTPTQSGIRARLAWQPYTPYGAAAYGGYSLEHGSAGKPVTGVQVSPSWRSVRFGTINLPAGGNESRVVVTPSLAFTTASVSSTTPVTPAANASPWTGAAWTAPVQAQTDDNVNSTAPVGGAWQWLSFNPAVPAGAVILGIELTVETAPVSTVGASLAATMEHAVWGSLSPTVGGGYQAVPAGINVLTFGGPTDLWGRSSWTVDDVNTGGWAINLVNINQQTYVDWLKIRVYYTTDVPLIDQVILVPARRRAVTATGRAPTDQKWMPATGVAVEYVKTVAADLSAVGGPGRQWGEAGGQSPATGLGGSLLELPAGDVDVVAKLATPIPETTQTSYVTEESSRVATLHFAVTPRWRELRDA